MTRRTFKKEPEYQSYLKNEVLPKRLPGCTVQKLLAPPQGIPDLAVFYKGKYAWLEVKKSEADYLKDFTPNQHDYISWANNDGAFAAFIYPENEEEVLNALEQSFGP